MRSLICVVFVTSACADTGGLGPGPSSSSAGASSEGESATRPTTGAATEPPATNTTAMTGITGATDMSGITETTGTTGTTGTTDTTGAPPMACAVVDRPGECVDVASCGDGSTAFQGLCADLPAVQCCVPVSPPCSVAGAPGLCIAAAGCVAPFVSTAGLCPGDASVQCCTDPATACDPAARPRPNEGLVEETWEPTCPAGMVRSGGVCIDRYEAALVELDLGGAVVGSWSPYVQPGSTRVRAVALRGAVPQGHISQVQAASACAEAGKRLCSDLEWLRACQGQAGATYPYGDVVAPGVCNDARALHPAIEFFGTADPWIWSELDNACITQIPDSLDITGQNPGCVSEDGVLDMMGNLHEWTADPAGTFRGGFFVDTKLNGPGCLYVTTAHDVNHRDYSTGFRCCAD